MKSLKSRSIMILVFSLLGLSLSSLAQDFCTENGTGFSQHGQIKEYFEQMIEKGSKIEGPIYIPIHYNAIGEVINQHATEVVVAEMIRDTNLILGGTGDGLYSTLLTQVTSGGFNSIDEAFGETLTETGIRLCLLRPDNESSVTHFPYTTGDLGGTFERFASLHHRGPFYFENNKYPVMNIWAMYGYGLFGQGHFPPNYYTWDGYEDYLDDFDGLPEGIQGFYIKYSGPGGKPRLIAHELGHNLGLLHTFANGCGYGDYIPDTPPTTDNEHDTKPTGRVNTCEADDPAEDKNDFSINAMAYNYFSAGFTANQGAVMRFNATEKLGYKFNRDQREQLLSKCLVGETLDEFIRENQFLKDLDKVAEVTVFPNPIVRGNSAKITIKSLDGLINIGKHLRLKLFDQMGRIEPIEREFYFEYPQLSYTFELPISENIRGGLYFLSLQGHYIDLSDIRKRKGSLNISSKIYIGE